MLRILFVDDEPKILDGLKRTLRPLRREWSCEFAQGGTEALQRLDRDAFDVVVTDARMPGMDGVELLKQIKIRHTHALRIVLSGQSELERSIQSSGVSHQYLRKPCSPEELKAAVQQALLLKRLSSDPLLIEFASKIDAIPSVSPVYLQLERLLKSSSTCFEEIGSVIAKDMGLCAKVLQAANSGCFARWQFIADPTEAAGLLGFSTLQSLLGTEEGFQECKPQKGTSFEMERLWQHSLQCSHLAGEIASTLEGADRETQKQAEIAGLLHDVGKLIIACHFTDVEAERRGFQASHAELGAYVMALWNIPAPIVEAIAYHHAPAAAVNPKNPVLMAVHAAELACRQSAIE